MEPGRAMHTPHLISVLCWAALAPLMRVLSSSRAIAAVQLAARTLETRPCPHVPRGYPATLQGCAFMLTCALVSCGRVTGRPGPLDGQQEEVIEYLASQPSFDAEVGCPVYYAVHFRNLPGLQSLLERSSQASLKECVSGFTSFKAVHVVGLRTAGQARALSRRIFVLVTKTHHPVHPSLRLRLPLSRCQGLLFLHLPTALVPYCSRFRIACTAPHTNSFTCSFHLLHSYRRSCCRCFSWTHTTRRPVENPP